ncbi:serine/threonine protein kinase [Calothrix sp. PCC 7507]|uniref:serine/threonine protein kinase n=1 Tax=Calothrix sp. PCC 7507 TaxID=99598 RepID=UPI00029F0351|nr:serine/threonine protein kinase [Calothrix sp. PCC 7507]
MEMLLNNRYQVIRTLGGGGFGETFLAEDTQMPSNRRCVIKQLKPIQNNPQIYQLVRERFQREAAILEDLGGSTDQIPSLYAYFQSEGQFYVVQEWVEGETLTAKIQQQGLLSESAVREILINLLPVLEYVHSKRIVHRDIKPDNIILRRRDSKPVLIDFGAVRESMGTMVNSQGNPTSSIVIGTPGYMPSEQAAGRPVYSSDLYSLGITAIYLLTGRQPQEIATDPRTGEIVWRQHALNVSPSLAMVIDRAIAYHPRDRYPTAREMLEALQLGAVTMQPTVPYAQPPAANLPPTAVTPQYTIPISPAALPQPINQSNGQRGIFAGSLIAGGLIGASIIIGFAINNKKEPQPIAQSSPLSSEQATINNQPQNTAPSVKTQRPDTTTRNEPQDIVTPVKSIFPSPSAPNLTPTPLKSETPSAETPAQVDRPSPEQAIQNYFATINKREFQTGWNQLSPNYQSNKRLHPNGYLSYIDWWGGKVESVDVEEVNLVEASAETATVEAQLEYSMKTGKVVPSVVRFSLLWDAGNSRWVVSDTK